MTPTPPTPVWRLARSEEETRRALAASLGISPVTAQVLINRGLGDPTAARVFLSPSPDRLSDPLRLRDMGRAVERLARAVTRGERVVVYGDYDADGVTATATLVAALRRLGAQADFYLPDRRAEGYGLQVPAVEALVAGGASLIVAVDCGATAFDAARAVRDAGADLVILDHHEVVGDLPPAVAVVNPKRRDDTTGADLCAAGLAYQACRALYAHLSRPAIPEDVVALAAIGTVADAVRLLGDNRILVTEGLARMPTAASPGLAALIDVAGARLPISARDLSHGLAPRLNAAGRLAHASAAARLLLTDDVAEARASAEYLDRLNRERRALCDAVFADAVEMIERDGLTRDPAIVLAREGWHPGVIGIVASLVVERYHRPALLIALHDGIGRGSARSIPALHLVDALVDSARHLLLFGGHAMAAGLTVAEAAFPHFREAFLDAVGRRLEPDDYRPVLHIDAELRLADLTSDLLVELERLAPFGPGNPEPVFQTPGLRAAGTRLVGDGTHLRLLVTDGQRTAEAIAFRQGDRAELLAFTQARLDLAYAVERDRWREGAAPQMVVEDLRTPDVELDAVAADASLVIDRLFTRAEEYLNVRFSAVEDAASFHTKVVGVTFEGRQALLPSVRPGERLRLARDPRNPADPHAIKVCLPDGRQLGFLRAALAARLAPSLDAGARYTATATALTGGGDRAWGLNIHVQREAPWTRDTGGVGEHDGAVIAGQALRGRLEMALGRGRVLPAGAGRVTDVLAEGRRAACRLGPGRGLLSAAIAAAAVLQPEARGPVLLVLPRVSDVEAWYGAAHAWLQEVGLRAGIAHGALPEAATARLQASLERGEVDVLMASQVWASRAWTLRGEVVILIADALTRGEDLAVFDPLAPAIRLVTGPMSAAALEAACGRWHLDLLQDDGGIRERLRVIDRRARPLDDVLASRQNWREKTLVVAADPAHAVAVARSMRERSSGASGDLAYYHTGLPATLRRVLEDLFAAGRVATLVAGSHLVDAAAPADVGRVVAVGLRPDRLLLADALAVAGRGGTTGLIELAWPADAAAVVRAATAVRFPSRDLLARCYRALRVAAAGGAWTWPRGASDVLPEAGLSREAVSTGLTILVEAGVVSRDDSGDETVYSLPDASDRINLVRSLRYAEGERERAGLADVEAWAAGPAAAILETLARG